jgi:omega-6 fatty acid desaturase (delta-12 desaturase)
LDNPKRTTRFKEIRTSLAPALRTPVLWKSWFQIANSFLPFIALVVLMHLTLDVGYWLTLLLAIPAAGFLVRIFIIQHDCGHGAFFRAPWANNWMGRLCSVLTLTPYDHWRREHHGHHTRWNCLDRRGPDIDPYSKCLTVAEYKGLSWRGRLLYRLQRHPTVMFLLVPPLVFLFLYRIPVSGPTDRRRAHLSVHLTTAAIGLAAGGLAILAGVPEVLLVQLPINILASIFGAWLFFVQHQFDRTSWVSKREWEFGEAVATASSYLNLPPVLRWFSGNIGLHHIHHFDYRIPNYHLGRCLAHFAAFAPPREISLWGGLRAVRLMLCDENRGALVRFADVTAARPA